MSTSENPPIVYLIRHGLTAWSVSGRHTELTGLPLTYNGQAAARLLGPHMEKSLPASNIPPSSVVLLLCDSQAALHPPFMHGRTPKECFDD